MSDESQGTPIFTRQAAQREQVIARFEDAHRCGARPAIDDFLAGEEADRHAILVELVLVDLECRLKAGESARVEEYLKRYPELAEHHGTVVELICTEYTLRRRQEADISVEQWLERFPQYRGELADRLVEETLAPSRKRFPVRLNCPHCQNPVAVVDDYSADEVVCPSCGSTFRLDRMRSVSWRPEKLPRLGKFVLLEAVGRGGFGTVYKARDTQLGRIVAVKVPRSGIFATQEDEDRFVREARSAAQLSDPRIVPVYEVGQAESFPYIVTQFVEGITLADALSGRRFSFRESAEIVAEVAEALEHSHQQGVIHRDLKPSNIMLREEAGKLDPLLMDFSLARREEGEVTVTMEGQILGTPAFMSPEQARGEGHRVDGRSDVYSLGVILYQCLVGELPFRGNMRMLLHQVLNAEPQAPRKLNDRIPRDLETITLKCLAKEPGRRYQTALALAEDLRRWLDGKPILARPIGRIGRLWRWAKRNPRIAGMSAAVLLLLTTTALMSLLAAVLAHRARESQRARNAEALDYIKDTSHITDLFLTSASRVFELYPGGMKIREDLLREATKVYGGLTQKKLNDPILQAELGRTLVRLGDFLAKLGKDHEAQKAYDSAIGQFAALLESFRERRGEWSPDEREIRIDLAKARINLGNLYRDRSQFGEAQSAYQAAIDELQPLETSQDNAGETLGIAWFNYGLMLGAQNRHAEARRKLQQATARFQELLRAEPDNLPRRFRLATARHAQGQLLSASGRAVEAVGVLRDALADFDAILAKAPSGRDYRASRAATQVELANALRLLGRDREQTEAYEASVGDYQALRDAFLDVPQFREDLATTHTNLSYVLNDLGRNDAAGKHAESALAEWDAVLRGPLAHPRHYSGAARSLLARAQVLSDLAHDSEAERDLAKAIDLLQEVVKSQGSPANAVDRYYLAVSRSQLGRVLHKQKQHERSQQAFQAAIQDLKSLLGEGPGRPEFSDALAWTYNHLGDLLRQVQKAPQAAEAYGEAKRLWEALARESSLPEFQYNLAWFLATCPDPACRDPARAEALAVLARDQAPENAKYGSVLGIALYRAGKHEASVTALLKAAASRSDGNSLDWFFLAAAYAKQGEKEQARQANQRAIQWMEKNRPGNVELRAVREEVAKVLESAGVAEAGPPADAKAAPRAKE